MVEKEFYLFVYYFSKLILHLDFIDDTLCISTRIEELNLRLGTYISILSGKTYCKIDHMSVQYISENCIDFFNLRPEVYIEYIMVFVEA